MRSQTAFGLSVGYQWQGTFVEQQPVLSNSRVQVFPNTQNSSDLVHVYPMAAMDTGKVPEGFAQPKMATANRYPAALGFAARDSRNMSCTAAIRHDACPPASFYTRSVCQNARFPEGYWW